MLLGSVGIDIEPMHQKWNIRYDERLIGTLVSTLACRILAPS
jgi:hypothetical protein